MSSSIRPPGAPPAGPSGLDALGDLAPAQADGASAAQRGAETKELSQAAAGQVESPTAQWLRRLEAGEVSRADAIEGLVAEAVQANGGARLSAAQRAELTDVLREALLNDPVLGELLG